MAKKRPPDRHKSGFMVRIPDEYRDSLRELKGKTGCPFAESVRRGLVMWLEANGIEPPEKGTTK